MSDFLKAVWAIVHEIISQRAEIRKLGVQLQQIATRLGRIEERLMSQETDLQDAVAVLGVVNAGITTIIDKLNALPTDNPALNDEIAAIKADAAEMAAKIDATLNP